MRFKEITFHQVFSLRSYSSFLKDSAYVQCFFMSSEKEEKQSGDTTGTVTKSVLKVLTSATFIRGAFGVLSKLLRK